MSTIDLILTTDTVCPWCYLLHARLQRAIELYLKTYSSKSKFNLVHKSYQLHPSLSSTSVPVQDKMIERIGSETRVAGIQSHFHRLGLAEGIQFSYNGRTGNSRDSHRLIKLAGLKGGDVQRNVVGEVYRMYYERNGDICDVGMLVEAGVAGGLDREEAEEWMRSGKGGEQVDREGEEARTKGIKGVPHLLINGEIEVSGAEDVSTLLETFISVSEAEKKKGLPGKN